MSPPPQNLPKLAAKVITIAGFIVSPKTPLIPLTLTINLDISFYSLKEKDDTGPAGNPISS
jgi:hypothetical protein